MIIGLSVVCVFLTGLLLFSLALLGKESKDKEGLQFQYSKQGIDLCKKQRELGKLKIDFAELQILYAGRELAKLGKIKPTKLAN